MLHIVQVVISGSAKLPKLFIEKSKAESAYVEHTKDAWAESYSAYCEQRSISVDCFASAQAFVDTLAVLEKGTLHYWVVKPEDIGLDKTNIILLGLEQNREQREHIADLTKKAEIASVAVKEELTELINTISMLTDTVTTMDVLPTDSQSVGSPGGDGGLSSPPVQLEKTKETDDMYRTPEWKAFVGSIMSICGGSRSEYHLFSRHDWRQDVYSNVTSFDYWEWVAAKIHHFKEKAIHANYSVIEDSECPGHYKFKTPEGMVSDISCYAEWEAWCHAGLHLAGC